MKLIYLLFLSFSWLFTGCSSDSTSTGNGIDRNNIKYSDLVWSDDFNQGTQPNSSFWSYDLGQNGWGNNEVQNYTNNTENVRIEDGKLIIEAHKTADGWSSARVKTQGKKNFTYGRIEVKAKLPEGAGTWPAIWMLGEDISTDGWPACGEIDIMEHVGKDPGVVHSSLHTNASHGATQNTGTINVPSFSSGFHVYAVDWTPKKMDFSVDGNVFYTFNPSNKDEDHWPFHDSAFLILNIAMGGNWGSDPQYETGGLKNGIDPSLTTVRMEIDYVKVYEQSN